MVTLCDTVMQQMKLRYLDGPKWQILFRHRLPWVPKNKSNTEFLLRGPSEAVLDSKFSAVGHPASRAPSWILAFAHLRAQVQPLNPPGWLPPGVLASEDARAELLTRFPLTRAKGSENFATASQLTSSFECGIPEKGGECAEGH